jgi:hypothetical protein
MAVACIRTTFRIQEEVLGIQLKPEVLPFWLATQ